MREGEGKLGTGLRESNSTVCSLEGGYVYLKGGHA